MFQTLFNYFFITTLLCIFVFGDEFPECSNEPMESFIAVSTNCSKTIYCNGVDSAIVDCVIDSPYFSPLDKNCHDTASVCGDRPFGKETITIATTTKTTLSITSSTATAPPTTTTTTAKPVTTTTPTAQSFTTPVATTRATTVAPSSHITTTVSSTSTWPPNFTTSSTKTTSTTADSSIILPCPVFDNPYKPVFLPHPKSCSQYYLCYYGKAFEMHCAAMLHFDVAQQACNTADRVNCQVKSLRPREQCLPNTVDVYPHPYNCNYYYLCEYGFLMVMQCPFYMVWDYEKRTCAIRSRAKCYNAF